MTISDISIRNPVFAWMVMAALIFFGLISYFRMGVSQLPNIDFPVVSVTLSWTGAAPEVMETDIVDAVESAIMGIQGVRTVSSNIQRGNATVTIEFDLSRNIDIAMQDVQAKISQVQRLLPSDMDPPTISKVNPEDQPIMFIAVSGGGSLKDLMGYVQDYLRDQFTVIPGVGDVFMGGFTDRNLRIWVDDRRLKTYQLTANDLITAVQQQHEEVPAGYIETARQQLNVRVMGEATTPQRFANIVIPRRAGGPVYKPIRLGDVAHIEDGLADIQRISRFNGNEAVGLGIRKQRGANEVAVARAVLKRLAGIRPQVPKNIQLSVAFNRTKYIEDSIRELTFTLILAALATSLVVWFFLGSWSATLNILLAIPTSILGTFIVIYFWGFTLNTFTVLGLTLAVGIVVDDAIMVLENIVRYRENGYGRVEAARQGARQITFAATATTLALIAIFLPIAFMSGIIGKFFYQYGVTISVAVFLSLFEALTLTPMRCSQFLQVGERRTRVGRAIDASFHRLAAYYRTLLAGVLDHQVLAVIVALLFFVLSLGVVGFLRKEFIPSQDQSILSIRIETPVDSSLEFTSGLFKEAERRIMARPEVDHVFSAVGGFTGGQPNNGYIFITLKPKGSRPVVAPARHQLSQQQLGGILRRELNGIAGIKAIIQDPSQSGFSAQRGFPVEFSIQGPDWDTLGGLSSKFMERMRAGDLMVDVDTDYLEKTPEIQVHPDRAKATARGVDVNAIGRTVNALVGGMPIGKYTESGHRYDVRIRLIPEQRRNVSDIERLQVWNNRGELVDMRTVVVISTEPASPTITRQNRQRAISIYANIAPGKSQTTAFDDINRIAREILPQGYNIVFRGSSQTFRESFISLFFVLFLGIVISYMVLASQFNSYSNPVAVLAALPFSISGALISLWIGRQSLNVYSLIGIILLMGIVKKNSILLVEFTNQYRKEKESVREALLAACPVRLRPILMTSIATIVAAIPPVLAIGPGAETRIPMAAAVLGGVLFSTMFTLFIVPCIYQLLSGIEGPDHGRGHQGAEEPGHEA